MPAVISKDIYGTTYALGYDSSAQEKVVRRHFVENANTLADAVTEVNTQVTDFATVFPLYSAMPLQYRTAKQIGVKRFIVEEVYGWTNSNWGNYDITTLGEFRLGYEATPVYTVGPADSTGLPPTTNAFFDNAGANRLGMRPQSYSWMRPVLRIGLPVKSSSNPVITWASKVGKVNSNSYTVGGLTFSAGQLRFDGAEVSARGSTGTLYQGSLMFSAAPSWIMHSLTSSSGSWSVTSSSLYPSVSF
jgi:hypothetical protein